MTLKEKRGFLLDKKSSSSSRLYDDLTSARESFQKTWGSGGGWGNESSSGGGWGNESSTRYGGWGNPEDRLGSESSTTGGGGGWASSWSSRGTTTTSCSWGATTASATASTSFTSSDRNSSSSFSSLSACEGGTAAAATAAVAAKAKAETCGKGEGDAGTNNCNEDVTMDMDESGDMYGAPHDVPDDKATTLLRVNNCLEKKNPFDGMGIITRAEEVPKVDITNWYSKRFKNTIPSISNKKHYQTRHDDGKAHIRRWTSVFTCPISGEKYASGQWGNPKYYTIKKKLSGDDVCGNDGQNPGVDNNNGQDEGSGGIIVWYHQKKDAEQAAARRALDSFSLMLMGKGPAGQLYLEKPVPPRNFSPYKNSYQHCCDDDDHDEDTHEGEKERLSTNGEEQCYLQPRRALTPTTKEPKSALFDWYRRRHLKDVFNTNLISSHKSFHFRQNGGEDHCIKWTCQFTCPVSGEVYNSGKLRGDDEHNDNNSSEVPEYEVDVFDERTIWYPTKKMAEHAAAARALDAFALMDEQMGWGGGGEGGGVQQRERLCLEWPVPPKNMNLYNAPPHEEETHMLQRQRQQMEEMAMAREEYRSFRMMTDESSSIRLAQAGGENETDDGAQEGVAAAPDPSYEPMENTCKL